MTNKNRIYSYVVQRIIDDKYYNRTSYFGGTQWCMSVVDAKKYRFRFTAWWFVMFSIKDSVQIVKI